MNMFETARRSVLAALTAFALAGCGSSDSSAETSDGAGETSALKEMSLGAEDAPVTIVEYASWTCPACLQFHQDVMPVLKSEYIETGKARLVFREFPTPPVNVAVAGFALGRCAGPDTYFDMLDELFDRQQGVLALVRQGGQVRAALYEIANNHGIDSEAQFEACLEDVDIRRAIAASIALGEGQGVNSTPTLFVNGERLDGAEWRYADGMRDILNEALGQPAPSAAIESEETPAPTDDDASAEAPAQ